MRYRVCRESAESGEPGSGKTLAEKWLAWSTFDLDTAVDFVSRLRTLIGGMSQMRKRTKRNLLEHAEGSWPLC